MKEGTGDVHGGLQHHPDTEVNVEKLLEDMDRQLGVSAPTERTAYQRIYDRIRPLIDEMAYELESAFRLDELPEPTGYFRSGLYDLQRDIQVGFQREATGRGDPRLFRRRETPRYRSSRVVLCVDTSASMLGKKIEAAQEALVLFLEVLDDLGIAHGVISFADTPQVLKKLERRSDPEDRERMLAQISAGGSTDDRSALKAATQMLERQDGERRVILYLTDGEGDSQQERAVRALETEGVLKVIGIGVGQGTESVCGTYPHHMHVAQVQELPRRLGELLIDVLR